MNSVSEDTKETMRMATKEIIRLRKVNRTLLEAAKNYLEMLSPKNEEVLRVTIAQAEGK